MLFRSEKLLNYYHTHDIGAACRLVAGILAYHAWGYNCHISALDYIFFFQKLNRRLNQKVCGVCASCLERLYAPVNLHLAYCGCARGKADYGCARSPLGQQAGGKSADGQMCIRDSYYPVFPDDPKLQALRAEGDQTPAGIQTAGEDRRSGQDPSPLCGVRQNRAGWSGVRVPVLFQMRGQL